ncbi:MAG: YihY/virulence factor BrkB family protein [Anaerolineae bacterium]
MQQISARWRQAQGRLDEKTGGSVTILTHSVNSFVEAQGAEAAAGLAYYALFSIFPLMLFFVSLAGSFLEDDTVQEIIIRFVKESVPFYFQDLIMGNLEQVLAARGSVQLISMIGLLWAASAVFTVLTHNIDRAWQIARERNFILGRLVGLGMIAAITVGLVTLWIISTTLVNLLPVLEIPLWNGESIQVYDTFVWRVLSRLIPWFLIFLTLLNLYHWVPRTTVLWREAAWGALLSSTGWEIAQRGFSWYLTSGFARYQLVYGSLGAVIAFMLWLYAISLIVLYGAHLSAAVAFNSRTGAERERLPLTKNGEPAG